MPARLPDFAIIGAMKCGTSTLHEQLRRRPGLFMSDPKEPNFFSDEANWARGLDWYQGLFAAAREGQRCGESSTHYTKLPTHPHAAERMAATAPGLRLVYVMRDPLERIASQYIHEWSQREVDEPFEEAVRLHERFVAYSCYDRQLEPYLAAYGPERVLPVAFERMLAAPDAELSRVCRFVGDPDPERARWSLDVGARNRSEERLRRDTLREGVLAHPLGRRLARVVPVAARQQLKRLWRLPERPVLRGALRDDVAARVDADLVRLGEKLGRRLDCEGWRQQVAGAPLEWAAAGRRV